MIDFPLTDLDMGPYLAFGPESQLAPPEYELFGIVNHFGTMHGGHYIAYVKN